ncbi:50S ribosomal protein L33 [Candidatus Amesbacteria bacterium RIFCSPHIGHO2_01_FULL_48_32]|uniref:Large ribosomal subunit protein bL33 n=1 Tax=Candidatus Amesbacteria bacterium RIFCSPLOWO2_01_FULL_48_25 TaxID=1797259 RepID=A0A1F4ZBM9_9BACT|nr:MAG: 50S ribosomal protein L33 [Candidatus Amesbacteria bacterium RIFCSPHIGHO2_01_FULL_48_32]OGD03611.1 MAG: 50S ribosomal protein L33 [Candidatus Amesbacteria bacterium RIFCSPLOWO2_01_FULL_48_25]HJZ04442.1 50S ribosomal protein L33 [Patescibacteria group bacterium]
MAKKGARQYFAFICSVCKSQNYLSQKNKINTPDKLELKKYCRHCRKYQLHKESSKLK